jgi:hypothetical protein
MLDERQKSYFFLLSLCLRQSSSSSVKTKPLLFRKHDVAAIARGLLAIHVVLTERLFNPTTPPKPQYH